MTAAEAAAEGARIAAHLAFLRQGIFKVDSRWPHYSLLLDEVAELAAELSDDSRVVILERAYVYGGDSLFAPLFAGHDVCAIDCQIPTAAERAGFQRAWTDDPRCIHRPADDRRSITATGLPAAAADLVLVPNVVHHEPDQRGLFAELARLLRPGGRGYIFEALLRELHQVPDDYLRYTPFGLGRMLADAGLEMTSWKGAGGPFEAISYCWIQALQYLPEAERAEREAWFFDRHLPELLELDRHWPKNLVREHTSFPVAFSVRFAHPAGGGAARS